MKILRSLKSIDILDLNYYVSFLVEKEVNPQVGFLHNFARIFCYISKQVLLDAVSILGNKSIGGKIVLFYNSVNQQNALRPLFEKLDNSIFVNLFHTRDTRIPMAMGCVISIVLAPRFFWRLNKLYKCKRDFILNNLFAYFFIEGLYVWWCYYLRWNKPKCIVFSNDHLVWHRVLRRAAQTNGIKTVYLQHASVTEVFPKLEFDVSLLEGKDALRKYSAKEILGEVRLVGMIKFDKYFASVNSNRQIKSIGVCISLIDDETIIELLCKGLRHSFPGLKIILRAHPRDTRHTFYLRMKSMFGIQLSDSRVETSFDFLKGVDVNFAGETSMHLEAVLMNVYPIYVKLSSKVTDWYGYLKNELVTNMFFDTDEAVSFLNTIKNNKPNIRYRAKYYVDTVDSEFDGASTSMILNYINRDLLNL